jgi:glycosyltransferase involved in cell wall biosynthesis
MNSGFDISIVISSYNRDDKVLQTVQRLFESDFSNFSAVEVIVIDDGSPSPVEKLLQQVKNVPGNVQWRLIAQKNAGIGATRNRGYKEAKANIVIFLDDDILVYPDTIAKLYNAIQTGPGPVIFGNYPFISHATVSLKKFAAHLYGYDAITAEEKFQQVNAITSGLLAVNKKKITHPDFFYKDNLSTPAAEEYEIIARFHRLGIPIYMATHIQAVHNHHLNLSWLVQQQYKYGLGTAESFIKYPEINQLDRFAELKRKLGGDKGMSRTKKFAASGFFRKLLLSYALITERILQNSNRNKLIGALTTAYFWAGYRDGKKKFSNT